jgi:GNAT superfamily N-acetyltransferase
MEEDALVIETAPNVEDVKFLQDRLHEYNVARTGLHDGQALAIFVRDGATVVAGLSGWTWGGWLKVNELWVAESQRRRGRGSRLLETAENEARARGCTRALLDTHSFQAPEFYQRRGYRIVYTIDDLPPGHRAYALVKQL